MQPEPGAPRGQAAAPKPPGAPPAVPVHSFSPTPSSMLLPTPLSMKPLASPEQATLAFAPKQWAPASAAAQPSAAAQGRSTGPPTGAVAAVQDVAPVNASRQDAAGSQNREVERQARSAAQPDAPGGELAHAAANGGAPLEPILRALEMLGTQSQQVQQQAGPRGQPGMPAPPLPSPLATSRGERSGRSSSIGPASNGGSSPPGIATVTTGPFDSTDLGGAGANGLLTPRAPPPAIPPLSTPAAAGSVLVVASSDEPSPLALPALVAAGAAAEASAPAAAAKSRRRSQQQRQQKQQAAEASARPPRPSKGKQAKRREEQPDGQQGRQEPAKRQRRQQRNSKRAAAAAAADTEQPSADAPITPSALPSDSRLPLYDSSSAQGPFHYTFGRSLLFELPPPTPPLELPSFRTAGAPPAGSVAAAAVPASPQQARTRPQPAVTAGQQAAGLVKAEEAEPLGGEAEMGSDQKRKRQRQRTLASKGKDEGPEAAAEFAPFAVSAPADNKEAPFSMRSMRFKGVYRMPNGRWRAQFTHRNKVIQIGMYDAEEEAARAWDKAAIQYRGLGTKINIPVSQACMAEWAKEKPVGWSLFYDDNDQPLPQPLAGAALQAKQRELQQKAAVEGKGKQEGKAVVAAPVASGPGGAAGGKRAAAKQQGGKAAAVASSPETAAAGRHREQGATPSPPGSPTAASAAGAARAAAHPAHLAASPQPQRQAQAPKPRASAAALASAPSPAPEAGPCQAAPAAAPPATPETAAAAAAPAKPAAGTAAAAGQPAIGTLIPIPAAHGPGAGSLAAAQPTSLRVPPAWEPGPLSQGQPAIVFNQVAPPVLVISQRFLPASALQTAPPDGTSSGAAQAERAQPKAPAAAKPKPSRQRERAPKRARQEERSGRKSVPVAGAAGGGAQRARRARRPAVRTLETVSGSDFSESESEEPGAASRLGSTARQRSRQQRGLDSSLIAAVAAAEAAEMAAVARQNGGASQLPPVATGTPAAAAAAAELGTPTGVATAGTPLSPGRPPHRSRKKAAQPAAEAFAFSPFLEIEVPAPLQDSGEAEEEWGGEEGMALDEEEWGPQAGRRRKQHGRSGQPRGLHGSLAAPSAPAQPPPLTMNLRGWSAKRQRTTPDSH